MCDNPKYRAPSGAREVPGRYHREQTENRIDQVGNGGRRRDGGCFRYVGNRPGGPCPVRWMGEHVRDADRDVDFRRLESDDQFLPSRMRHRRTQVVYRRRVHVHGQLDNRQYRRICSFDRSFHIGPVSVGIRKPGQPYRQRLSHTASRSPGPDRNRNLDGCGQLQRVERESCLRTVIPCLPPRRITEPR